MEFSCVNCTHMLVLYRLMSSALAVLAAPCCLDAARNATLNIVESLLDLEGERGHQIVMAHVEQLLDSLKAIAITAWTTPVSCSPNFCNMYLPVMLQLSLLRRLTQQVEGHL